MQELQGVSSMRELSHSFASATAADVASPEGAVAGKMREFEIEMERLAASMGGSVKWPYNNSECLDADFFKVVADHLVRTSGVRPLLHSYAVDVIKEEEYKIVVGREGTTLNGIRSCSQVNV